MPTYPMKCEYGHKADIIKSIHFHDTPETCPKCFKPMSKDYGDPGWARQGVANFSGHFNESLGCYVGSQRDIKDAQNKIRDLTGSMPIELGNEKPRHAPAVQKFTESDVREAVAVAERLQADRGEVAHA